jgi:hypothetical protein
VAGLYESCFLRKQGRTIVRRRLLSTWKTSACSCRTSGGASPRSAEGGSLDELEKAPVAVAPLVAPVPVT